MPFLYTPACLNRLSPRTKWKPERFSRLSSIRHQYLTDRSAGANALLSEGEIPMPGGGSGLVGFSAGAGAVGSLNTVPVTEFDQFGTFIVEFFHFLFLI